MQEQSALPTARAEPGTSRTSERDVTRLLLKWNDGNKEVLDRLIPLVGKELRRTANVCFRAEGSGHTLQPTALVNELYLRLLERKTVRWSKRSHFFAFAARTMRRILVDHARAKATGRRGAGVARSSLSEATLQSDPGCIDLVRLDDALRDLAQLDRRQSQVVELRYFAGLTLEEIAGVVGVGVATVGRDWLSAKAWLGRELSRR